MGLEKKERKIGVSYSCAVVVLGKSFIALGWAGLDLPSHAS